MRQSSPAAVRVVFFGFLRERLGTEILVRERVATILDLWSLVTRDQPELQDARARVRAARNLAYCDWQTPVEPGDEVAFMPPVTGGSVDDQAPVRLRAELVTDPIDVSRLAAEVRGDGDGAIATFVGAVRRMSEGQEVQRLDYEAYLPMADRELRRIAADVAGRHGLSGIALVHRIGSLEVGELSVAVVAAAPHRQPALLACSEAVEILKRDLPVWKREHHPDGALWVEAGELGDATTSDGGGSVEGRGDCGQEPAAGANPPGHRPGDGLEPRRLSHLDPSGSFRMVDVSDRPATLRAATAEAVVRFSHPATLDLLYDGPPKGDVLAAARLAGIMGAKRTPDLIPLCHPIPLSHVDVRTAVEGSPPGVRILSSARCTASTGVEMEALTAAAVAGLTIVDMLKSADPWVTIESVRLLSKSGGRSGEVHRP